MKQIYCLGYNRFGKGWAYLETEDNTKFSGVEECPLCGRAVSMMKWQPPLNVFLSSKKIGDLIFGTLPYPIVSARFKELYEASDLRGIKEFRKVDRIRYKKEIINADYYYIQPERFNVNVAVAKGEHIISEDKYICELCTPTKKVYMALDGLIIGDEAHTINGDIFLIYTQGDTVFCNERFAQFCKDNKMKNWEKQIIPASEYKLGYFE